MSAALTGDVSSPTEPKAQAISDARDAIARDLAAGAVVVSARHVKSLLLGFDLMVRHIAEAHKGYEADCNRIVSLRLGAVMHAVGAESVTLSDSGYEELKQKRASLHHAAAPDGRSITYTLSYPEDDAA